MNYFIEGIQGSGKTTMAERLHRENPDYHIYREGDYSPVELAWCANVNLVRYESILEKYVAIADDIRKKTVCEGDNRVIAYTQILTDIPGFHKDLEQYEIYNGNMPKEEFEAIILKRFSAWTGENEIFECSIFQNIIENQLLYLEMTEDEVMDFYRRVHAVLEGKDYEIIYMEASDIRKAEEIIRKERCDDQGNEMWFPLMAAYMEVSPYGQKHNLVGMDGLVTHLERRVALERRMLEEIFPGHYRIIKREI